MLGLIGLGMTNREIGGRLGIAEKTVKNTVTMVLAKLGFQRRAQAVIYVTVRTIAAAQAGGAAADRTVREDATRVDAGRSSVTEVFRHRRSHTDQGPVDGTMKGH